MVRKDGCLSLHGVEFDAGPEFVGKKVELRYDRLNLESAEIWENGRKLKTIYPRGTRILGSPAMPMKTPESASAGSSRYLNVLEKRSKERRKERLGAIAYRKLGGDTDV